MPTLVTNSPKRHHARNKLAAMESPVQSTGYTTHSMTDNREEVSWSSSDGSTYYSHGKAPLEQQASQQSTEYSEDEISLQQRKQTRRVSKHRQDYNADSYSADHSASSSETDSDCEHSCNRKETTRSRNNFRPQLSSKLVLEDVDHFSAIEIATGSEGVSAVAFLTTEDTAEVFCKVKVPREITANKTLYEKVSAISSASAGSSSAGSSSYSSDSDSEQDSRRHQTKDVEYDATSTDRATVRSQASKVSTAETSVRAINRHVVDFVSVSYQDPVSSLECASTWDDLSLDSNTSGTSSVKKSSPIQRREIVKLPEIDSKVKKRVKEIKRKKSDLETDEKIRQLKAKIKSIQDLSATQRTVSSTEVDSEVSSDFQSKAMVNQKAAEHENKMNDEKLKTDEPLMNEYESQEPNRSAPARKEYRMSIEAERSLVGTMVPVMDKEEVSVLRFDASARDVLVQGDIEEGQFRRSKLEPRASLVSVSEHTKAVLTKVQYKVIALYDQLVPIIARKRAEFLRKPRYEQILIVAIGSLCSIFLVLLCVMIGQ